MWLIVIASIIYLFIYFNYELFIFTIKYNSSYFCYYSNPIWYEILSYVRIINIMNWLLIHASAGVFLSKKESIFFSTHNAIYATLLKKLFGSPVTLNTRLIFQHTSKSYHLNILNFSRSAFWLALLINDLIKRWLHRRCHAADRGCRLKKYIIYTMRLPIYRVQQF